MRTKRRNVQVSAKSKGPATRTASASVGSANNLQLMDDNLSKPFHPDGLRENLNRFGIHPRSALTVPRSAEGPVLAER
jgi:hypothetical protein